MKVHPWSSLLQTVSSPPFEFHCREVYDLFVSTDVSVPNEGRVFIKVLYHWLFETQQKITGFYRKCEFVEGLMALSPPHIIPYTIEKDRRCFYLKQDCTDGIRLKGLLRQYPECSDGHMNDYRLTRKDAYSTVSEH